MLSKTLAEEAAWKFAEGNGIDLVTINAGFVIGPILQPTINTTVETIYRLLNGLLFTAESSSLVGISLFCSRKGCLRNFLHMQDRKHILTQPLGMSM